MQIKQIQNALKTKGIRKTVQEILDFLTNKNIDKDSTELEIIVQTFEEYENEHKQSAALATQSKQTRRKQALQKFEEKPEAVPEDSHRNHNDLHDVENTAFNAAVTQVAELNVQKTIVFPQAVAAKTYELLNEPETQQALQESMHSASENLQRMMYGFNPQI